LKRKKNKINKHIPLGIENIEEVIFDPKVSKIIPPIIDVQISIFWNFS
jgi:hypothetical protein